MARSTTRRREPPVLSGDAELDAAIQSAAAETAEQEVVAATQKRGRGRPRKNPVAAPKPAAEPKRSEAMPDWTAFRDAVSLTFLSQVFRMDRKTVKQRIRKLDPIGSDRGNDTYDFLEAASYLVEPRIDLREHIAGLRPQDLPPTLQAAFWVAQEKRMEVMAKARRTWSTDAVLEAVVLIMKGCKEVMLTIPQQAQAKADLTDEQHDEIEKLIRAALVMMQGDLEKSALARLLSGPESRAMEDAEKDSQMLEEVI